MKMNPTDSSRGRRASRGGQSDEDGALSCSNKSITDSERRRQRINDLIKGQQEGKLKE